MSTSDTHPLRYLRSMGFAACRERPAIQADGALRASSVGPPAVLPITPRALTVIVYALSKIEAVSHGWPSRDAHAGQRVVDIQALQSV